MPDRPHRIGPKGPGSETVQIGAQHVKHPELVMGLQLFRYEGEQDGVVIVPTARTPTTLSGNS